MLSVARLHTKYQNAEFVTVTEYRMGTAQMSLLYTNTILNLNTLYVQVMRFFYLIISTHTHTPEHKLTSETETHRQ